MAHMLMICPLCKYENTGGTRFCKNCGRLLVEPDLEASAADHAPLYATPDAMDAHWERGDVADIAHARIVIRAYPADFDGSDSAAALPVGEYALGGQTITIGRGQNCAIVFDKDTMVSRRHAILRPEANQYIVTDLGSSNGTFINDVEITAPTPVKHGDRILIGQHELLFLLDQPHSIAATPPPGATAPAASPSSEHTPDAAPAPAAPAHPTGAPTRAPAGATAKYASVARLSSELAASASRMVAPQQDGGELDAIRARLVEASEALTRQAGIQAALADRRRSTLVEARERVADLISDLRGDDTAKGSPTPKAPQDLVALADRVADDPNNLEHLRALAQHASAIAQALRAQGPSEGSWNVERARVLRALEDIHLRLQERA